jgi:hypothetical protein
VVNISKKRARRLIADAALRLRRDAGELRAEGMEFLIFARQWVQSDKLIHAEIAVRNAVSVLRPLWKTKVLGPSD